MGTTGIDGYCEERGGGPGWGELAQAAYGDQNWEDKPKKHRLYRMGLNC